MFGKQGTFTLYQETMLLPVFYETHGTDWQGNPDTAILKK